MKKVVGYVRVSTHEQADEGYSISEQQDRLKKYCDAQGWTLVHIYVDPGYSGAKLDRPALQQLLSDIPSGAFDTVLVFKLDRLSRSQKDTMYLLEDQFIKNNIDFCSVMESSLNTSTPLGKAMIGILSVFAQLERNNITERMAMGRVGRAKSGKHSGGSTAPFGYDYINGELAINESEAVQVRLIYDLFLNGIDGKDISFQQMLQYLRKRYLKRGMEWAHSSSLSRIIQNPVYCGMIRYSGQTYPGLHDPIVSREIWDKAQVKYSHYITSTAAATNFDKTPHLLTGLIKCGVCGATYRTCTCKNKYLTASSHPYYGYYMCRPSGHHKAKCSNKSYKMDILEEQVLKEIKSLSLNPEELKGMGSEPKTKFSESPLYIAAMKHLEEINKQVRKLLDLYQIDGIDIADVSERIKILNEDKYRTNVIISEFENSIQNPSSSVDDAIEVLKSFDDVSSSGDIELLRTAIRSLIDKIVAYPDHIEIHWSFAG